MTKDQDYFKLFQEAQSEAKDKYVELRRQIRDDVVLRPLMGERRTPAERQAWLQQMRVDSAQLLGQVAELRAQYRLPEDKPIPRRLAEALERVSKEAQPE